MRSEFDFINDIKSRYHLSKVGDDCAVLPKDSKTDLLITSDMLVEGVDFRLDWATAEQIGHKALTVSLSDVAAMGGTPRYAMLSIAIVENLWKGDFLKDLYVGWNRLARNFKVELIGGDISRTSGPITIDSTVLGDVPKGKAILRSGAKPGDAIYVMGALGAAAGGLRLLASNSTREASDAGHLVTTQLRPEPSVNGGKYLQKHGLASAMIDISDGLSSDIRHICEASGVGAELITDSLPIHPELKSHFSPDECLNMALHGGEDFLLLFTGEASRIEASHIPCVSRIGTITPKAGLIQLISGSKRSPLEPRGYRHF